MIENILTLLTLILLQVVLGFDNLLYISLESKKAPEKIKNYTPTADSTIRQGLYKNQNYGGEEHLSVQRHPNSDHNKISFLKFKLEGDTSNIKKATLLKVAL